MSCSFVDVVTPAQVVLVAMPTPDPVAVAGSIALVNAALGDRAAAATAAERDDARDVLTVNAFHDLMRDIMRVLAPATMCARLPASPAAASAADGGMRGGGGGGGGGSDGGGSSSGGGGAGRGRGRGEAAASPRGGGAAAAGGGGRAAGSARVAAAAGATTDRANAVGTPRAKRGRG